ncbi:MAG: alpha/beta fold hydrolase [Vicinamibacterales bacterium]
MPPRIVVRGTGRPIVLIPGIQGRYEWGLPTVEALARLGRVITYSLADEPTSAFAWNEAAGFENYLAQLDDAIQQTAAVPPVLVGVSYGGLVATEFAARHPAGVAGLVVASAPPPAWTLPERARRYLAAPRLMAPAFWLGAPFRIYPELKSAIPDARRRLTFMAGQGLRIAAAPASSRRMIRRLRWLSAAKTTLDHPIDVPALIVVGEPALERVVPPDATLAYRAWLPRASVVTLTGTGHGGTVTRAGEFAAHVAAWMQHLPPARPAGSGLPTSEESVRADRVS